MLGAQKRKTDPERSVFLWPGSPSDQQNELAVQRGEVPLFTATSRP